MVGAGDLMSLVVTLSVLSMMWTSIRPMLLTRHHGRLLLALVLGAAALHFSVALAWIAGTPSTTPGADAITLRDFAVLNATPAAWLAWSLAMMFVICAAEATQWISQAFVPAMRSVDSWYTNKDGSRAMPPQRLLSIVSPS